MMWLFAILIVLALGGIAVVAAGRGAPLEEAYDERTDANVPADAWTRRGLRSNGSEFTIATISIYHLHDIVHHAYDVRTA